MFILVPLFLILASVIGVSVIVYRKMPYLKKLSPEIEVGGAGDILTDLFPEFSEGLKNLKLNEYKDLWFKELEKFLRRLRVVSLKMDRISDSWIKKIRNGNWSSPTFVVSEKRETTEDPVIKAKTSPEITTEDMKREEQRLIIEIAKNPKDFNLYEILGDLYVKMKSFSDAKESYEAAIELNSRNEELQKKRSQVVQKMIQ